MANGRLIVFDRRGINKNNQECLIILMVDGVVHGWIVLKSIDYND